MPSNKSQGFLDAFALPSQLAMPWQERIDPRQEVVDSLTEMLEAIQCHDDTDGTTKGLTEQGTMETCTQDPSDNHTMCIEHTEPVILRERLVLRSNVPIPTDSFLDLHESYRDAEAFINQCLVNHVKTGKKLMEISGKEEYGFSEEDYILLRCALREICQAELKTQAQIDGVIIPEIRSLVLLEQFFRGQGSPNEAEVLLLCQINNQSPLYLKGWFAAKERSFRAVNAMKRKLKCTKGRTSHDMALMRAFQYIDQLQMGPLSRDKTAQT